MQQATHAVKVWDIWVRITHWAVAIGIFANLIATEGGSDVHEYIGYAVAALVVARLIWGFIGTKYARFSNFLPTPTRIKQHIGEIKAHRFNDSHLGHNPFGALMMFALWAVIIALGITGYLQTTDQFWGDDTIQQIHELLANSLWVLVPLHVAAAVIMGRLQQQNLIKSMITGKKIINP